MGSIVSHIYDIIQEYGSYDNYLKETSDKELAEKAKQNPESVFVDIHGNEARE